MAFLRASWAREVLGEAPGAKRAEEEAAELFAFPRAEEQAAAEARTQSLRATVTYENDFEDDDDDEPAGYREAIRRAEEECGEDKENLHVPPPTIAAAADDEIAAVRQAMQRQLSGAPAPAQPTLAPLNLPLPSSVPSSVPAADSRRPGAVEPVNEASESALKAGRIPAVGVRVAPQHTPTTAGGGRRKTRSLLANSLDTFEVPRGVLWQPDRKEVYTSVAFVFQKHIELNGRYLLVRAEPPPSATMSALPSRVDAAHDPQGSPDSVLPAGQPPLGKGDERYPQGADHHGTRRHGEDAELIAASPDLPCGVRQSFLMGARSMHGLRYSIELSPVAEVREPALPQGGASSRLPVGGKFGVPLDGQGEEWRGEEWASEEEDDVGADLSSTAIWEGEWAPAVEDFSLFDEELHPLRSSDGAVKKPSFNNVSNYIRALAQSARMGAEASVVALAYIERLVSSGGFPLNERTWRRCAVTAWLLASKMWDDECLENPQFASLFGYHVDDINALEQRFVAALEYRLSLSSAEYARYYFALRSICQTSSEAFPLRPLDADLEAKLARSEASINGCARGAWAGMLDEYVDLSRSM